MIQIDNQTIATSPCINVCALDSAKRFCQGCFRTIEEISAWSSASNDERLNILAAAACRRKESGQ